MNKYYIFLDILKVTKSLDLCLTLITLKEALIDSKNKVSLISVEVQKKLSLPNIPEARGLPMSTSVFADADLAGDKRNRRSQTGILIFYNKAPIYWYSNCQPSVESSIFGAEFRAMKTAFEMVDGLRYKLGMFDVPIDGSTSIFSNNEAVYKNTVIPESTLHTNHHSIAYHRYTEAVAANAIRVSKEGPSNNLADIFTKLIPSTRSNFLSDKFTY